MDIGLVRLTHAIFPFANEDSCLFSSYSAKKASIAVIFVLSKMISIAAGYKIPAV